MARSFLVEDILDDIEFEILQGTIANEQLGKGIETVRAYQNKARSDSFEKLKLTDPQREIFSRQFQITDMLLNLLMELALTVQSTQQEARQIRQYQPSHQEGTSDQQLDNLDEVLRTTNGPVTVDVTGGGEFKPAAELESIMQPDAIVVESQVRPVRIPIIGGLLTRLRYFYQRPALHYSRLLAYRQYEANRILGEHILFLEALVQAQQAQIERLQTEIKE